MSFSIGFSVSTRCGWVLGACTAALLLAGVGSAQNLVVNGDFDTSVEFWAPDTLPIFVAEDWEGDPESGSLRLANESPTATNILVSQCVVLAGTEPLIFEGAFRSAISGDTTGRIRIGVSWRTTTDCGTGRSGCPTRKHGTLGPTS